MPPLEHMDMRDPAVLWTMSRHDRDGFPLVNSPTEICCRWEEKNLEMTDADGNRIVVDAVLAVGRNLVMGSLLWAGKLCDLPDSGEPPRDLYEVVLRDRGSDLKGRVTRYEFGLKRYKDKLPRVVG